LRNAYFITCTDVVRDPASGAIVELRCSYDPASRGGSSPDGRKVKGTIHWVAASAGIVAEVRLYDRLFSVAQPGTGKEVDYLEQLNPGSIEILRDCRCEPGLAAADPLIRYQFERQGYFCLDPEVSATGSPVFNRIATLRDSWSKNG
jgi:glutaminyl-tRNA synthetase